MDINSPEFAQFFNDFIRDITRKEFLKKINNLIFTVVGKVAENGSGSVINCFINNSNTPVPVKNPRNLSLSAGQLVAIVYPNFSDKGKYIDRIWLSDHVTGYIAHTWYDLLIYTWQTVKEKTWSSFVS